MSTELDLTTLSTTFPDLPEPQIPRDNLIGLLHDRFGPERKVIIVQGPVGAGKSTLLAQFARTFPDRCFTFFVGTTLPTSHPRYFLLDLCEQVAKVLRQNTERIDQLDTDGLKQLFVHLYRRAAREARISKVPYYFIIDGLEWISVAGQDETILDLLPAQPPSNIRLLASSDPYRDFPFQHDRWDIPFFALRDTELYLAGLGLCKDDIQRVHKSCQGMPGYLGAIRRLMVSGVSFEELPQKLPDELRGLFEIEWARMKAADANFLTALALLAFSKEPLTLSVVAQIIGTAPDELVHAIRTVSFLRFEPKGEIASFVSDAYKQFAADRLRTKREHAEGLLLGYYERDPYTKASLVLLPTYLAKPSTYENLKALVSTDYLIRAVHSSPDITVLRRTLRLAADQAHNADDWSTLYKYTVASSILTTIGRSPVSETEVEALLELGDYSNAFETAYHSLLAEDRLQLLARVCTRMRQAGLSVPENILAELEQMAAAIDPASLRERALEIAAVLFDLLPGSAIDLVERSAGGIAGDRSLDIARASLAVRLEADPSEMLRSRISDQALRDFTRVASPRAGKLSPHEVIAEAEKIDSTSGKLFLLGAWCNENRKNPLAAPVVEKALEVITADPAYATPMRLLRQLAEPLKSSPDAAIHKLCERLDLLKGTALSKPFEETVRLNLVLAALEARQSSERALTRLIETFFSLETLDELDVRCYCLARILISLPEIDPADSLHMREELEEQLLTEFGNLLRGSADHWTVTRRTLRAVTEYKPELAFQFAGLLNTVERRDKAFNEVLNVYAGSAGRTIDFSFVQMVLNEISKVQMRELTIVRLIERLAESGVLADTQESRQLLDAINSMRNPRHQSYASAFALSVIGIDSESGLSQDLSRTLLSAIENVDAKWKRVTLLLDLACIVAKRAPQFARTLLEQARRERVTSPLADKFFADIYVDCVRLVLRAFSGVLAYDPNYKARKDQLLQIIHYIPSHGVQCELLADLALRYRRADKSEEFSQLIQCEVLPYFNDCADRQVKGETLIRIGPALFSYDSSWTIEQLSSLPVSERDEAFYGIFAYLLTKVPPGDPADLDAIKVDIDPKTARQICHVIAEMTDDAQLSFCIDQFVNALVHRNPHDPKREICVSLIERDALDIAERLKRIAVSKLPNPDNIQHNGYLIASQACVARLRAAATWRMKIDLPWSQIASDASTIPNAADRALVLAWVAEKMFRSDPALSRRLLSDAEALVPEIPNLLDRASRFYAIAKSLKDRDERDPAKTLLHEAMSLLKACSRDRRRDNIAGQVLQLAHGIDPDFASSITPLIDNPIEEHLRRLDLVARTLQRDPHKLQAEKLSEVKDLHYMVSEASWRMLESLNSGFGHTRHPREVGQWLRQMIDGDFAKSVKVIAWSVQNTLLQTKQLNVVTGLYENTIDSVRLCMAIGQILLGIRAHTTPIMSLSLPETVHLFPAGRRAEALVTLHDWLASQVSSYVKIYDPYFSVSDLEILKFINPECQVYIVTSWRAQKGVAPGDRGLERVYRDAWTKVSDKSAPWTQVTIVGSSSGDSPLHNRYVITEGKGLALGTSIGGLGVKDSEIHILDAEEASRIESEFVDPQLGPQLRLYKGERLITHVFIL